MKSLRSNLQLKLIDFLGIPSSKLPTTPDYASPGVFHGKHLRKHPGIRCGNSILDKGASYEVRAKVEGVRLEIGDDCIVKSKFIFEETSGFVKIGNGTFIGGSRIICRDSVVIGDWVTISWGVTIYDHDSHSLNYLDRIADQRQQILDWPTGNFIVNKNWNVVPKSSIRIENYVWIGFDAVILKGVTLGEGCVVGARSVVTKSVEPWTVVAGNPARVIRKLNPQDSTESAVDHDT
jgi:acetyltransferase-like isoleucine patch superfamily enzyme